MELMGTRAAFLKDPRAWYNSFWLKSFAPHRLAVSPNSGHEALAALCNLFDDLRIITQNIDSLHHSTSTRWSHTGAGI